MLHERVWIIEHALEVGGKIVLDSCSVFCDPARLHDRVEDLPPQPQAYWVMFKYDTTVET